MSMMTRDWKTLNNVKVESLEKILQELVAEKPREFHIGTDSQQDGKVTQFVTVVVVITPTKGARAFYCKEKVPRIKSLRERLLREVSTSVQMGLELNGVLPEGTPLSIHVDANPNTKFKSSEYVQELAGYVAGQGFEVLLKPDSWAATHAADHVVKGMVVGR
jgi:predicted RNase H-related nuclease YkuK (DUF458 family)